MIAIKPQSAAFKMPFPPFVFWWDTCSLDLYAGCSICISCVALDRLKGVDRLVLIMLSFFHPQIEKIMTLIGAGIDFSRDQQYATPGRVLTLFYVPRECRWNGANGTLKYGVGSTPL